MTSLLPLEPVERGGAVRIQRAGRQLDAWRQLQVQVRDRAAR